VSSFHLDESFSVGMSQQERSAREFLSKHIVQTYRRYCHTKKKVDGHEYEINRYAVKRLRHELVQNEERFERAAIDLVLEGQLLCTMNHPNIIGLRGWNGAGADAFRSLMYSDYFLILDRLVESLDERIEDWRGLLRKYRSRLALPWLKQKAGTKMHDLFRARIQVAHDLASAIEYMHDRRIINRDIKSVGALSVDHSQVLPCTFTHV
jgi:serine/threonine protein kinase